MPGGSRPSRLPTPAHVSSRAAVAQLPGLAARFRSVKVRRGRRDRGGQRRVAWCVRILKLRHIEVKARSSRLKYARPRHQLSDVAGKVQIQNRIAAQVDRCVNTRRFAPFATFLTHGNAKHQMPVFGRRTYIARCRCAYCMVTEYNKSRNNRKLSLSIEVMTLFAAELPHSDTPPDADSRQSS